MGIRSRLYDAKGIDSEIRLTAAAVRKLTDERLLWVDVEQPGPADLGALEEAFKFPAPIMSALGEPGDRARLVRADEAVLLTVITIEGERGHEAPVAVDLVAGRNAVVTLHARPVSALEEFASHVSDVALLGRLDAASFMGGLVDTMLGSFRHQVEQIELQVDRLDEMAMRGEDPGGFLERAVALRRRAAVLRRLLVPQRETFGPLARPDFALHDELGKPWAGLVDRLEQAISGVERTRELLVGSSDIYLGRLAQRSGDVMKALTIVSAVLLPAVVVAGVMGMNFKLGFFDNAGNFWLVIAAMLGSAALVLGVARLRHWI
jgi:Mg2+ and Co2+ transporter CorA